MLNKTYDCVICYCDEHDWRNHRNSIKNSVRGTPETLSNIYENIMAKPFSERQDNPGKHWAVIVTAAVDDTGVSDYIMEALIHLGVSVFYKKSLWDQ